MQYEDEYTMDLRRSRADQAIHAVLIAIMKFIPQDDRQYAYDAMRKQFVENGWEIITDEHRKEAGLPPRGPKGWTQQELYALEQARMAVLMRPITGFVEPASLLGLNDEKARQP